MLAGQYDLSLVLVSMLVAVRASFTALSIANRVKQTQGNLVPCWILSGAVAMGSGIWAMHFIGMLAFSLPIALGYDVPLTSLSLVIPIAVASGGAGQDTTFTVRIPSHEPLPDGLLTGVAPAANDAVVRPDLAARTILVVDDNADSLLIAQAVLAGAGAIDLLISDIGMPGLDGYEMLRRVRASSNPSVHGLPAIALSGLARKEYREHALAAGYTDYLVKPVFAAMPADSVAGALTDLRLPRFG